MLSLTLIQNKLDNFHICPEGKGVMSIHQFSTMFATLMQRAADVRVILLIHYYQFCYVFLIFLMLSLILIQYKLDNFHICPYGKGILSRHQLSTMIATLQQLTAEI